MRLAITHTVIGRTFARAPFMAALTAAALLCACEGAPAAPELLALSDQSIGDICAHGLSFDVTGPYYASCKNYLRRHAVAQPAATIAWAGSPEHRACQRIGLEDGTPDFGRCVQELNQLDVSAAHL